MPNYLAFPTTNGDSFFPIPAVLVGRMQLYRVHLLVVVAKEAVVCGCDRDRVLFAHDEGNITRQRQRDASQALFSNVKRELNRDKAVRLFPDQLKPTMLWLVTASTRKVMGICLVQSLSVTKSLWNQSGLGGRDGGGF